MTQREFTQMELRVDWIRCSGHGLCAEIAPELVTLDDWGYPVVANPVPRGLEAIAERARTACPAMALKLTSHAHLSRT